MFGFCVCVCVFVHFYKAPSAPPFVMSQAKTSEAFLTKPLSAPRTTLDLIVYSCIAQPACAPGHVSTKRRRRRRLTVSDANVLWNIGDLPKRARPWGEDCQPARVGSTRRKRPRLHHRGCVQSSENWYLYKWTNFYLGAARNVRSERDALANQFIYSVVCLNGIEFWCIHGCNLPPISGY